MDIDAIVEINNFFLIAETKNEGVPIPTGQQYALDALMRSGLFTLIKRWGKAPPGASIEFITAEGRRQHFGASVIDEEVKFIRRWADWADKQEKNSWRLRLVEWAAKGASLAVRKRMIDIIRGKKRVAELPDQLPLLLPGAEQ